MPPWFGQRPPLPKPLRRHGCPVRVRAPQGLSRSSRTRARSSVARSLASLTASRFAALAALAARRSRTRSSCSARRAATKRSIQLSDFIPRPHDARVRACAYCALYAGRITSGRGRAWGCGPKQRHQTECGTFLRAPGSFICQPGPIISQADDCRGTLIAIPAIGRSGEQRPHSRQQNDWAATLGTSSSQQSRERERGRMVGHSSVIQCRRGG
jgi:hypothetical protein